MENQRLFVGNLSFETTKEELSTLFSQFGCVSTISLRPKKGFAFVAMSKPEEAMAALNNLDRTDFKNRPLRISLEIPKKKARIVTRDRYKQTAGTHSRKGDVENSGDEVKVIVANQLDHRIKHS